MPAYGRPEFLQLRGFVTVLITPIQLGFDSLYLVLLWQRPSAVDVGRDLIARPSERDCCVKIQAALLQLSRGPIAIGGATIAPCVRRISIPRIRVTARYCWTGRGRGLVCAADQPNGNCC